MHLVRRAKQEVVELLWDVSPAESADALGMTVLHHAAQGDHVGVVQLCLRRGLDLDLPSQDGSAERSGGLRGCQAASEARGPGSP